MSTDTPGTDHVTPMTGPEQPSMNSVLSDEEGRLIAETPRWDQRHQFLSIYYTLSITISGTFTALLLLRVIRYALSGTLDYLHWTNYAGIATGVVTMLYCLWYFLVRHLHNRDVERLFAEVVLPAYVDMTGKRYDGHMYTITEPRQTQGFLWTVATRDKDGKREMHQFVI